MSANINVLKSMTGYKLIIYIAKGHEGATIILKEY